MVQIPMHVRGAWPAMLYTCLYSVHPYWWKRQVSHQLWPSGSQHASKKECRWDIHSGFETHEEGHTKSKTGVISGSTKWTLVQTKIKKKKAGLFHTYHWIHNNHSWLFGAFFFLISSNKFRRKLLLFVFNFFPLLNILPIMAETQISGYFNPSSLG